MNVAVIIIVKAKMINYEYALKTAVVRNLPQV